MTRKHYLAISALIAREHSNAKLNEAAGWHSGPIAAKRIATALADYFASENPNGFDRERFLRDCGVASAGVEITSSVDLDDGSGTVNRHSPLNPPPTRQKPWRGQRQR